jgi:hypothetical protein
MRPIRRLLNPDQKKVLVLMSNTGGGHRASAEALEAGFKQLYGDKYVLINPLILLLSFSSTDISVTKSRGSYPMRTLPRDAVTLILRILAFVQQTLKMKVPL